MTSERYYVFFRLSFLTVVENLTRVMKWDVPLVTLKQVPTCSQLIYLFCHITIQCCSHFSVSMDCQCHCYSKLLCCYCKSKMYLIKVVISVTWFTSLDQRRTVLYLEVPQSWDIDWIKKKKTQQHALWSSNNKITVLRRMFWVILDKIYWVCMQALIQSECVLLLPASSCKLHFVSKWSVCSDSGLFFSPILANKVLITFCHTIQ